jgi:hypothetical protein
MFTEITKFRILKFNYSEALLPPGINPIAVNKYYYIIIVFSSQYYGRV